MYSKIKYIFYLLIILFLLFPKNSFASVLINEISPSTDPEWIELYNDGESEINLSNYLLEDGNSIHTDDLILTGTVVSKGFIVLTHSEGWLNNGGDTVKLYNNASPSAIIDQYTYSSIDSTKSIARIPNGSENWQITSSVTNNSTNPTPTPSPTATATPTPTTTASPTPKPTPTKTPTPKPTPTLTSTPIVTIKPQQTIEPLIVLNTKTPIGMVAGASTTKKSPILAIILIISGISFLGYGGYLLYNMRHAKI